MLQVGEQVNEPRILFLVKLLFGSRQRFIQSGRNEDILERNDITWLTKLKVKMLIMIMMIRGIDLVE